MSSASIASGSQSSDASVHQLVVPVVAALLHVHREASAVPALHDDRRARSTACLCSASSAICFERHDLAAAVAAVGGDEQPRLRVVDAVAQRLGAEAAEDDAVHRADARAGQHRNRELRDQRHVDARRGRPCLTPSDLQHVGELARPRDRGRSR